MKQCLKKIHLFGAQVVNLTCYGPHVNISTLNKLGARISFNDLNPRIDCDLFDNPIFVILDSCHILNNVRNAFYHYKQFKDGKGNLGSWKHIEDLVKGEKICTVQTSFPLTM